jgi:hypothetical protein
MSDEKRRYDLLRKKVELIKRVEIKAMSELAKEKTEDGKRL